MNVNVFVSDVGTELCEIIPFAVVVGADDYVRLKKKIIESPNSICETDNNTKYYLFYT